MRHTLVPTFFLAVVVGFALSPGTSHAQAKRLDDIKLTPKLDSDISELKKGENPFKAATARPLLNDFMKYFAEKVQHPGMYTPAQEFGPSLLPMDSLLIQFNGRVLVPELGQKYSVNQADYIAEFGKAFVAAFKPILENNPDRIVRLNAARLLAVAASCGAPSFGPLVTDLIANPNTPPEVKYYAFKAAEGLLGAYDILKLSSASPRDHTLRTPELLALLAAIEANIYDPTKVLTFPQGVDPKQPSAELGAVVSYIRRQAVRAFARVRFAAINPGNPNGPIVYPAFVLARIAMSDPALAPAPGPSEVAEAVIGICGMQPDNSLMINAAADAAATGIITFAASLNNLNAPAVIKTTPWKLYAARMRLALQDWKKLVANASVPANRQPQAASELADVAIEAILAPLEQQGEAGRNAILIQKVDTVRQGLRAGPNASPLLFRGVNSTSLAPYQR